MEEKGDLKRSLPTGKQQATQGGLSPLGQLTSTFSTTCFPKEHTLVEQVTVMFSELSY